METEQRTIAEIEAVVSEHGLADLCGAGLPDAVVRAVTGCTDVREARQAIARRRSLLGFSGSPARDTLNDPDIRL